MVLTLNHICPNNNNYKKLKLEQALVHELFHFAFTLIYLLCKIL